jgi:hypothetical protein
MPVRGGDPMGDPGGRRAPLIERTSPRAVFAGLVAEALAEAPAEVSPLATSYLVELLEARLPAAGDGSEPEPTLAEAWLAAAADGGSGRLRRLRQLGDRALFVSGYFGPSLSRSPVGGGYYRDMGRNAYAALASALGRLPERAWPRLFEELADRFAELAAVLAEVSDRVYGNRPEGLLALYERYLATRSPRLRARLLRAGCVLPAGMGRPQ